MRGRAVKEQKSPGFSLLDILLPQLTIPVRSINWIAGKLHESAVKELTDKSKIHRQLLELQMRYELEELGEEEYDRQEKDLLDRLEEIRQYEQRMEE